MPRHSAGKDGSSADRGVLAVAAVAVLAVVCCAGGPAIAAVLGSLAVGSVLGWAAGAVVLVGTCTAVTLLVGRRRKRSPVGAPSGPRA